MTAANDDLSPWAVEDLNCFAFGSIYWILGVDLSLGGSDFSGLLSCELELKLQPMGIADATNDERATERIEAVFTDPVDRFHAIDIDGKDSTVLWSRTQAYSLDAWIATQLRDCKSRM